MQWWTEIMPVEAHDGMVGIFRSITRARSGEIELRQSLAGTLLNLT